MLLLHHVNFLEAQPRTGFCSNNALILYRIIVFHTIAYSILRSKKGIDKIKLSVPFPWDVINVLYASQFTWQLSCEALLL